MLHGVAKSAGTAVTAPAAQSAGKGALAGTGWIGLGAGAAGLAITLLDVWKQSVGSTNGLTAGSLVSPSTIAIGGGAALLTFGEKAAGSSAFIRNGTRGAGIALVLGGLAGAVAGAVQTFGNPNKNASSYLASTQIQTPSRFSMSLPPAPANLLGIEVASADVIGSGRKIERVPIYLNDANSTKLEPGTDLSTAIGQARAAAQSDPEFRSHAVVQTSDGSYWIMRLSGKLDQVDGPKYAENTQYDSRYEPLIERRQPAIQAIAGVEKHYIFPEDMKSTAPARYSDTIPWVTPSTQPAISAPTTSVEGGS